MNTDKQFIAKRLLMLEWNTQSLYWLHLAPNDFWLSSSKVHLERIKILGCETLDKNVTAVLKVIPNGEFHKSSWQSKHHYAGCTAAQGNYFEVEGDLVTLFLKPYV